MPGLDRLLDQLSKGVTASKEMAQNISQATNPLSATGATWGQTGQAAAYTAKTAGQTARAGGQAANQWGRAKAQAISNIPVYTANAGAGSQIPYNQPGWRPAQTMNLGDVTNMVGQSTRALLPNTSGGPGSAGGGAGAAAGGFGSEAAMLSPTGAAGLAASMPAKLDAIVGAAFKDLRLKRDEVLELERARLVARGGTGDYHRFKDNMDYAVQKYNVQSRSDIIRDVGNVLGQGMGQLMTNKRQGLLGEERAATMVGEMHTLAAASGVQAQQVAGAMNSLYSAQSYYAAMATGIQTRDPRTGNALQTSDIINQYAERMKGSTTDDIRRSLAPGGMFRAELEQTWNNADLVDMISEGLLAETQTGKRSTGKEHEGEGGLTDIMREAGYFGTEWTQGKDSASHYEDERTMYAAQYTNAVTAGMEIVNEGMASFTNGLNNLQGPLTAAVAALEAFGGASQEAGVRIPATWGIVESTMVDTMSNTGALLAGAAAIGIIRGFEGIGDLITSGTKATEGQDWTTQANREWRNEHASWFDAAKGLFAERPEFDPNWSPTPGEGGMSPEEQALEAARAAMEATQQTGSGTLAVMPGSDKIDPTKMLNQALPSGASGNRPIVYISLTVSRATDEEAVRFAQVVRRELSNDDELMALGSGTLSAL